MTKDNDPRYWNMPCVTICIVLRHIATLCHQTCNLVFSTGPFCCFSHLWWDCPFALFALSPFLLLQLIIWWLLAPIRRSVDDSAVRKFHRLPWLSFSPHIFLCVFSTIFLQYIKTQVYFIHADILYICVTTHTMRSEFIHTMCVAFFFCLFV